MIKVELNLRSILTTAANNPSLQEVSDHLYYQTQRLWALLFDRSIFPTIVEAEIDEIEQTTQILSNGNPWKAEEFRRQVIIDHVNRIGRIFGYPQEAE